jgi:The ARF-like 2 binding protein BART
MSNGLEETIRILINLERIFTEPGFVCDIEDLLNNNLELFGYGEQSIQSHQVFTEFSNKIESKLEEFVQVYNISEEDVLGYCKTLYETDPNALTCFEYILSACDYNDFLELMLTRRSIKEWRTDE